ncbi:MAG: FAD:protein FMN transferase [Deltaproteobacteria bacterium]|nr:FAD:protein FMN transferase [Deltaproteobacteria bacterium]
MTLLLVALALPANRSFSSEAMSTRVEVTLPDDAEAAVHAAGVFAIFRAVEEEANEWREGSPLARVNAAAGGEPVAVPAPTHALVKRGIEISQLTGGKFDLTWAALWDLWDFRARRVPTAAEVSSRLPLIDYARVELGSDTVRLPEAGMKIGLGGIAKGWALDRARQYLDEHGRRDFLVSAGGQVYAAGHNAEGQPWRVGVRDPDGEASSALALLGVSDASVSTSGDYERYFERDGVRYHHIIDPGTGWPARGLRAVTVVSADATLADAASTAIMVAGPAGAAAMVKALGVEALWIASDGMVYATGGMPITWRR